MEATKLVDLSANEKQQMCRELAAHLPKLRDVLTVSQDELAKLCGLSRTRISQIETGSAEMSWVQLMSVMMLINVDYDAKQYFFASRLFGPRFLQFLQRKEEKIPPDPSIRIKDEFNDVL